MEWMYRTEEDLSIQWDTRLLEQGSDSTNIQNGDKRLYRPFAVPAIPGVSV
jgi:hypothetical protein